MAETGHHKGLAGHIAGFGLDGFHSGPPAPVDHQVTDGLLRRLDAQNLVGFALEAVGAGWLTFESPAAVERLHTLHRDALFRSLTLERALMVVDEAFEKAGVETVVLKGSAFAHGVYPDPGLRPSSDLDLLVRGGDFKAASAALESAGFPRQRPEPSSGFDERFGKAAVHRQNDGVEVDLHRTLVVGPHGLAMDPNELFGRVVPFGLAGRILWRLDDTAAFLHACMHASLGFKEARLLSLRDVLQLAESPHVNWDDARACAQRWRLRAVVGHALSHSQEVLCARAPEPARLLAASLVPSARETRWLEAYVSDRRDRGGTARATLGAIPSIAGKVAYSRSLLFPSKAFVEVREGGTKATHYAKRLRVAMRWAARKDPDPARRSPSRS